MRHRLPKLWTYVSFSVLKMLQSLTLVLGLMAFRHHLTLRYYIISEDIRAHVLSITVTVEAGNS